jgi:hypothetical protein
LKGQKFQVKSESAKTPKRQNAIKKKKNLDQMEAINPLNHYYNLFCLGGLSENISKIRITLLLFFKIKLHNGAK